MVLQGSPTSSDIHDMSECHHLYDLEYAATLRPPMAAKNLPPPINLTVLTLTPKNYP